MSSNECRHFGADSLVPDCSAPDGLAPDRLASDALARTVWLRVVWRGRFGARLLDSQSEKSRRRKQTGCCLEKTRYLLLRFLCEIRSPKCEVRNPDKSQGQGDIPGSFAARSKSDISGKPEARVKLFPWPTRATLTQNSSVSCIVDVTPFKAEQSAVLYMSKDFCFIPTATTTESGLKSNRG